MRTTDKLYNAKVKRADSRHELGEVGEGLRQLARVVQRSPSTVAAYRKATAFQATMHCGLQGEAIM